jgi:hypothetical protein
MLVAVLHFVPGEGAALPLVRELLAALPTGSYLVATNSTKDLLAPAVAAAYDRALAAGITNIWPRDHAEFSALFGGLTLADPGIVPVSEWRASAEPGPRPSAADVAIYGAVGRKP